MNIKVFVRYLPFSISFMIGSLLRCFELHKQILLDDEWHGIYVSIVSSFKYLVFHWHITAPSIPFNLYRKLIIETVGLNEVLLRLPSLAAGILALWLFPLFISRIFKQRVAMIFSFLLALSPLLIFFSRYSRPYSIMMFFSFISIFAFYFWIKTGHKKDRLIFITSTALATYFHLLGIIPFLAIYFFTLFAKITQKKFPLLLKFFGIAPSFKNIVLTGLAGMAATLLLLSPSLIVSLHEFLQFYPHVKPPNLISYKGLLELIGGTSNTLMLSLVAIFFVVGLFILIKKDKLLAGFFITILIFYYFFLNVTSSPDIHNPLQIARYCIPIFPLSFLTIALGLHGVWELFFGKLFLKNSIFYRLIPFFFTALLIFFLFLSGPIPTLYTMINNFTNHAAYQESYGTLKSKQPYSSYVAPFYLLRKENMPNFYKSLSKESGNFAVLEHPMLIGNHFNFYYYYQRIHKKEVLVGFYPNVNFHFLNEAERVVFANMPIDIILSRAKDKTKLKFSSIVNILNTNKIKKKQIKYIIFHKDLIKEGFNIEHLTFHVFPDLPALYYNVFGKPVYEDEWITVFQARKDL